MHILYLSQFFPPEIGATQTRGYEMATGLIKAGHRVTVICEVPNHPKGIIHPHYRRRFWSRESANGLDVIRVWVKISPDKNISGRLAFYLSYMVNAALAGLLLARGRYDLIVATSPPLFVGGTGLALSFLRRIPLIFEVRDIWPKSAVELGEIRNRLVIRSAEVLEHLCYRRSARIVAVTGGIQKYLRQNGYGDGKVVLIPNGANTDLYQPWPRDQEITRRLGLEGKFVLVYAGLHGLMHGMDSIVECARILKEEKDILFLLIGEGVRKDPLISLSRQYGLHNVLFLPEQPETELPRYYSCANVGLSTTKNLDICKGTLPVKMFSYMASGLPVISAVRGEARELVELSKAGISVEPEDPAQLAEAILKLKANPSLLEAYGKNGRDFVRQYYDRGKLAADLEKILREVVEERKPAS